MELKNSFDIAYTATRSNLLNSIQDKILKIETDNENIYNKVSMLTNNTENKISNILETIKNNIKETDKISSIIYSVKNNVNETNINYTKKIDELKGILVDTILRLEFLETHINNSIDIK